MPQTSPYTELSQLPAGSIVGTSSLRRSAQLQRLYPELQFRSARGNIHTRLNKLDAPESPFSCLILAAAGLLRVGLGHRITKYLNDDEMLYAVGQGAVGIEIRKGDAKMKKLCNVIGHRETTWRCCAERSLLRRLEGGCSVPVGVSTTLNGNLLSFKAVVLSVDGSQFVEASIEGKIEKDEDCLAIGIELAELLIQKGAKKILDEINFDKVAAVKNAGITGTASPTPTPQ